MKYNDFINSTEHQRIYDEIVPMGIGCEMTFANSYPLDWGRAAESDDQIGFRRKMEFLCTGFKDFINESDLCIGADNSENEHDQNMRVFNGFNGMHFFHDFPKGKTIAESYPFVKEKYDRRIKRLMALINSNKKICFCFCSLFSELPKSQIVYSTSLFYKIFPDSNADFLILQNDLSIGDDIIYEELSKHVRRIVFGEELSDAMNALKSGTFKLKQLLNAMIMPIDKKTNFNAVELISNYHDGDIITNPTSDYKGIISFGPYVPLDSGNHTVTVDYELTDNYNGFVDVACDKGKIIVPKIELPHNQKQFKFDFKLDKNVVDLEVRFFGVPRDATDKTNKFKLIGIRID